MNNTLGKVMRLSEHVRASVAGRADRALVRQMMDEDGEVAELAKSFDTIISQLESNISELKQTKNTLHDGLSKIGRALTSMEDFDSLSQLVLETTIDALGCSDGAVFSLGEDGRHTMTAVIGRESLTEKEVVRRLGKHLDEMKANPRILVVDEWAPGQERRGIFDPPLVCAPLTSKGRLWGTICIGARKVAGLFGPDEMAIIENLSYQMAISFENLRLSRDRDRTYFDTISALALAVEARDLYSRGHSERVGDLSAQLGAAMNISAEDIQTLRDAARLHDIGKIGISDSILLKPDSLSSEEKDMMMKHPIIGQRIVTPLRSFDRTAEPIRHHHVRLDGSGYPDGLQGDEIPSITRIIMVADTYDVMTTDRPYRKSRPWADAREEFETLVGNGQMDASVVATLFTLVESGQLA